MKNIRIEKVIILATDGEEDFEKEVILSDKEVIVVGNRKIQAYIDEKMLKSEVGGIKKYDNIKGKGFSIYHTDY